MFCVIYRFRVREAMDEPFVEAWSRVTKAFIEHCGGLGSRLHRAGEGEYVAYAQWPNRDAWESAELPQDIVEGPVRRMRECTESIETLHELNPVADLLIHGRE